MCRQIDCPTCGRPTFAGCGMHGEQVLGNVRPAQRCQCGTDRAKNPGPTTASGPLGWLKGLLLGQAGNS
jgi:hypothetical protein